MIEMLGVLAIIGVLSVGGIAGYSKAMLKYKTNKTIDQIAMLTTNIRTLYAQQDTFQGLGVLAAANMGVVPDEMIDGTIDSNTKAYTSSTLNGLVNPFSGSVTITVDNSVPGAAGANAAFVIGVNGIPKEACMAMVVSDWGSNYSSGLIGMAIANDYDAAGTDREIVTDETSGQTSLKTGTGTNKVAAYRLLTDITSTAEGAGNNSSAGKGVFAGSACATTRADATSSPTGGAYCAKDLPIPVSEASVGCNCDGSTCSVAFKYY